MNNKTEECICSMALVQIPGIGAVGARKLVSALGSASDVFRYRTELPERVPGAGRQLVSALDNRDVFVRAERELEFVEKNHIRCLTYWDEDYPSRLRECADAPIVLFYKGNADLNRLKIINMVGTRHATPYGKDLCVRFLRELHDLCPDVLVVSGLAYGIDIHAHRAALACGLSTVAVLAHGLDRIYPVSHRKDAVNLLQQGGLLTEYPSGTVPDKYNFVSRNRIVAGMCDATVVVESALKGGSLITAEIAESYQRDCFAFPGRVDDVYSAGCNRLISTNRAALLTSAAQLVEAMGWEECSASVQPQAVQRSLFPDLTEDESRIVQILSKRGDQQINALVVEADIPVCRMSGILFELEMKGVVRALAGGIYHLLA